MAYFQRKDSFPDWCHICGTRQTRNVEIWHHLDAEHVAVNHMIQGADHFTRICADCGETIAQVGRGETDKVVRNNPAIKVRRKKEPA
jgi:hypothetical protein